MILKSTGSGGSVALIAPASPFDTGLYDKGRDILEKAGYRTVPGESIFNTRGYLAGTDFERARDLTDALLDPRIDAVICIRGGYGCGRLLPWIPFHSLADKPKIFLGHSDITFLHLAFLSRMGWTTLHGPNITGLADKPEAADNVFKAIAGEVQFEWTLEPDQVLRPGSAKGPVIGGNLTCLTHLLGTPYLPDMTGALLLIEDCGEALYRLDRMLNHLKLAGILQKLAGILIGEFVRCADYDKILEMIMEHVRYFDYPVLGGLPFGHGERNDVIPLGTPFLLDSHSHILRAIEAPIVA
ncbi:MAG: LD-carboxypeptidase [Syntrophobacteraceae bacterium]